MSAHFSKGGGGPSAKLRTTLVAPRNIQAVCRDPNDDFLLAMAQDAGADVLVTRDEDLLILAKFGLTEIVHVAEFLKRLQS